MATPTKLKGAKPVDLKVSDLIDIVSELKRLRQHSKAKAHMDGHTVSVAPETVNSLKDFVSKAKLDSKSETLAKVANAPARCNSDSCEFGD